MNEKEIREAIQKARDALGPSPATVFWPLTAGASIGLAAYVLPLGCSVYGDTACFIDHYTTSDTTTHTHTTTDTTSEPSCEVDLVQVTGATEQCAACVQEHCCQQGQTYAHARTKAALLALFSCATDGPCSTPCADEMCGYTPPDGAQFFHACNRCIADNGCCANHNTCFLDDACRNSCLYGADAACCEPGSPYKPYDDCAAASCSYECPAFFMCPTSHPGEGGAGGAGGGTAGAGGAAGAGGLGGAGGAGGGGG